ncbi:carboxylesterase [Tolypocladium capitatum]|uniref:Carboxylesterase n=1 Tax=Tolypocladium capitatum TaxID=45235 RepID=A0A2K3QIG4_9HYPO|nr:carboxylesterase [Tolypocladium capitatum]
MPEAQAPAANPVPGLPTRDIFNDFDILGEPYVVRDGHPIVAHILLPKNPPQGPRPVLINWHGGYLIMAHGLFPPFFPRFILNLAKKHSAIIISPDHTLLPHKDGLAAVQADMEALHAWMQSSLTSFLANKAPSYEPDLSRILLHGSSAGAYVAMSQALASPKSFRAISLVYPMIDFDTEWWRNGSRAVGAPNPIRLPDAVFLADTDVKERVLQFRDGPRVSAAEAERQSFGVSVARGGFFADLFSPGGKLDDDPSVWVNRRVRQGAELPGRIWVLHGEADSAVPVDTSLALAETLKKQDRAVRLDVVKGMDHGFDNVPAPGWKGPEDPLILEATAWLAETWLE